MFSDEDRKKLTELRDATLNVKLVSNDPNDPENIKAVNEQNKKRQEFIELFQELVKKLKNDSNNATKQTIENIDKHKLSQSPSLTTEQISRILLGST